MAEQVAATAEMRPPTEGDVDTIAGWHPMASGEVLEWWQPDYVQPGLMLDDDGEPVGYGERPPG